MKIRTDFVTNSSSTNFVIISSKDLEENQFAKFLGFTKESPFWDHIGDAVYDVFRDMIDAEDFTKDQYYAGSYADFDDFAKKKFSEDTYAKVLEAQKQGKKIYYGRFRSEDPKFLCFLCCDNILLEGNDIYFDATECGW